MSESGVKVVEACGSFEALAALIINNLSGTKTCEVPTGSRWWQLNTAVVNLYRWVQNSERKGYYFRKYVRLFCYNKYCKKLKHTCCKPLCSLKNTEGL